MFGPKELDAKNTYIPNLQDIKESAERTYGEANAFFRKEDLYLQDVERRIESGGLSSPKDIYDECHSIASDLAKCCEMYLKALYIFENNVPGNQIDNLWEKLKKGEYKTDDKGNLIYLNSSGFITFMQYDQNGNPIVDTNGKPIYYDQLGNTYNENNRGAKIKQTGHQLDRLIELLSQDSRILLETRMLRIPMESTEKNSAISIMDVLANKGIIDSSEKITSEQYLGWIDQHKKTFEEARYSGQQSSDVSVEFLYHLATQIKAVAQYKIEPKPSQSFTITDEELSKLPPEIKNLAVSYPNLLSEELVKLIANDEEIRKKISSLFSNYYKEITFLKPEDLYRMIKIMSEKEIIYTIYLCQMLMNYNNFPIDIRNETNKKKIKRTYELIGNLRNMYMKPRHLIKYLIEAKVALGDSLIINIDNVDTLFKILRNRMAHYNYNIYNIQKRSLKDISKSSIRLH